MPRFLKKNLNLARYYVPAVQLRLHLSLRERKSAP